MAAAVDGGGGGLDLFDVIIPSRTWRIQDRVSAVSSAASSLLPAIRKGGGVSSSRFLVEVDQIRSQTLL